MLSKADLVKMGQVVGLAIKTETPKIVRRIIRSETPGIVRAIVKAETPGIVREIVKAVVKAETPKIVADVVSEKLGLMPTKEEFYAQEDMVMTELKGIRQELVMVNYRLGDHEERLERVEKKVGLI